MKHVEIETLIRKFEGRLGENDLHEITAHVAQCCECAARSATLAGFFAYAELHVTHMVPQAATARILNIYQRKPVVKSRGVSQSIASLIFDDWQVALNERHSGIDTRQMLYRIGDSEIDLRLELVGDMCRLTGQVFPGLTKAVAEISSAMHIETAVVNEVGEFTFVLVPQGIYDFRIVTKNEILSINEIPLHE